MAGVGPLNGRGALDRGRGWPLTAMGGRLIRGLAVFYTLYIAGERAGICMYVSPTAKDSVIASHIKVCFIACCIFQFESDKSSGCILLLYSVILSRSIQT